ncbi:MAG: EAL domain-containing protein [Rhodoblastus sp.]
MAATAPTISRPDLMRAIDRRELSVVFQPQLTADAQSVASVEALLRWRRPDGAFVSAEGFVELAERAGLIDLLGLYVLEQACTAARAWPRILLAVNISPTHFAKPGFVDDVARVLDATWFPPERLEIEIVESAAFADPDFARKQMDRLHALGARVAMDDFGTGYSSLSLLQRLPFDKVKIDKSFVDGIPNTKSVAILHAMIALVRALGMKVTAEGVETVEQQRFLKAAGCHYLQGFLYARPLAAEDLPDFLERFKPAPR